MLSDATLQIFLEEVVRKNRFRKLRVLKKMNLVFRGEEKPFHFNEPFAFLPLTPKEKNKKDPFSRKILWCQVESVF